MADLNILVVGEKGSGKSTAARIVCKALSESGFIVGLLDDDHVSPDKFDKSLKSVRGKFVRVTCGNARIK